MSSVRTPGLVLWCAVLGAGLWLTHLSGAIVSSPPLSPSPGTIRAWASSVETAEAVVGVGRLMSLALLWYLTAVTVAAGLCRACGRISWAGRVERVTPPPLRALLTRGGLWTAAGLTVASTPILAANLAIPAGTTADPYPHSQGASASGFDQPGPSTADRPTSLVDPVPPSSPNPEPTPRAETAEPSSRPTPRPEWVEPTSRPTPHSEPAGPAVLEASGANRELTTPSNDTEDPSSATGDRPDTWTVEPGDHFWRIAEEVVADANGAPAPVRAVAEYWVELVEANRGTLMDPTNPDLIYPGQVFVLPPT